MGRTYAAFGGRVEFVMRFQTLGSITEARRLYNELVSTKAIPEALFKDVAGLALYLAHTEEIRVLHCDHPEIEGLKQFAGWLTSTDEPSRDAAELWRELSSSIGSSTAKEWEKAYLHGQASSLSAPVELRPDEALTEEQAADPN